MLYDATALPPLPSFLPSFLFFLSYTHSERETYITQVHLSINNQLSMFLFPHIGLSYPSKNIGIRKSSSSSSRTHLQEEVTAILNETSGVFSFTAGAGVGLDHDEKSEAPVPSSSANSFLSEIFDDQSINDLLND